MRGGRTMRIETVVAALLLLSAAWPPLSAQEREDAGSSAWTTPEGPVLLQLGDSYTHALSALPVRYPGSFYALAGAGTVTYAPDRLASNTDVRRVVGGGGWFRLNDHVAVKSVVREDMSWFSVPGADGGLQHQLTIGGTMVLSIP